MLPLSSAAPTLICYADVSGAPYKVGGIVDFLTVHAATVISAPGHGALQHVQV